MQPYPGNSVEQQIAGHLNKPLPQPSLIRPGIPAAFDEVVAHGMAKNPHECFQTAGDLATAARPALAEPNPSTPLPKTAPPTQTHRPAATLINPLTHQDQSTHATSKIAPSARPDSPPTPRAELPRPIVGPMMRPAPANPHAAKVIANPTTRPEHAAASTLRTDRVWSAIAISGRVLTVTVIAAASAITEVVRGDDLYLYHVALWFGDSADYIYVRVAVGVLGTVGVVLLLTGSAQFRTRPSLARRCCCVGAGCVVFALIMTQADDYRAFLFEHERTQFLWVIALIGALLLLVACWCGLAPSSANTARLLIGGVLVEGVAVACRPLHLAPLLPLAKVDFLDVHGFLILGTASGFIAGGALIGAGLILAVRRWSESRGSLGGG